MTLQITLSAALISCLMHALWRIKCLFLRVWSCGRTEREQKGCKNRNVWSCVCILLSSWAFDLNFFILLGGGFFSILTISQCSTLSASSLSLVSSISVLRPVVDKLLPERRKWGSMRVETWRVMKNNHMGFPPCQNHFFNFFNYAKDIC